MQGFDLHMRIRNRIHALLDRQLMQMAEMLMSEDRFAAFECLLPAYYLDCSFLVYANLTSLGCVFSSFRYKHLFVLGEILKVY